jgi:hypothetical protein
VSDERQTPRQSETVKANARPLTEADAIDIWIARWLRIRQKDLLDRYHCDSRRLYEIWWGERFPSSRRKAADRFRELHPNRADRTDFGYRRIPRTGGDPHQNDLFD